MKTSFLKTNSRTIRALGVSVELSDKTVDVFVADQRSSVADIEALAYARNAYPFPVSITIVELEA